MKIGIDVNWAIYESAGIGKYTYNLVRAILMQDTQNQYVLFSNFIRHYRERKRILHSLIAGTKAEVELKVLKFPAAWMERLLQTNLPAKFLYPAEIDVFHSPFFSGIAKNGFPKQIVTLHDMVFAKFPEHRGQKLSDYYFLRTKTAVENCAKIIVPSASTKKDVASTFDINPNKIVVIPEGVSGDFKLIKNRAKIKEVVGKYLPPDSKYILSVGTIEPRKNLVRLLRAYAQLPHEIKSQYKLVLIGKKGWNNAEFNRTIESMNLAGKIILTGYVSDEDLPYLYNGASVFCYPSLYEGFGLPPLEAMACGVPVITSNTSSLPEVVDRAGLQIDPQSEDQIAAALKRVLTEGNLAKSMSKRSLIQASKFSWEKAAAKTIKVYEEVYNGN